MAGEAFPPEGRRIVTVSASYGAGGSVVAPRLADRLGLVFLDRLLAVTGTPMPAESVSDDERASTPTSRWLIRLARIPAVVPAAPVPAAPDVDPAVELRRSSEAALRQLLAAGDGLVLGRAGAVVLAGAPRAYHVRLDGPVERRLARAAAIEGIDVETARRRQTETDKSRSLFVRRLYDRDPADPRLYHLVIDTTVLALDTVVEVAAAAAEAFWAYEAGPGLGELG